MNMRIFQLGTPLEGSDTAMSLLPIWAALDNLARRRPCGRLAWSCRHGRECRKPSASARDTVHCKDQSAGGAWRGDVGDACDDEHCDECCTGGYDDGRRCYDEDADYSDCSNEVVAVKKPGTISRTGNCADHCDCHDSACGDVGDGDDDARRTTRCELSLHCRKRALDVVGADQRPA